MPPTENRRLLERAVEDGLFGADPAGLLQQQPAPDGYRLVRELGRGGAGAVWLAHDLELDRPVALKFLANARPADVERFRREARFAARLRDPAIVQVYELGEVEGEPFIAMQYVEGGNLADAELALPALLDAMRSVVLALEHAHRHGIVHRDIKPENILLDREQRAYLTDFGIARDLGPLRPDTLSLQGQIMGTPGLMPPEQARGDVHAVDGRSDVYSLGATLYCKLCGRRPFEGDNVVDVLHAVIHDEPALPRALAPQVPRGVEAIILKCLRKERDERYQSMRDLHDDLARQRAGAPVTSESGVWFRRLVGKLVGAPERPVPRAVRDDDITERMEILRELAACDATLYRTSTIEPAYRQLDALDTRLTDLLARRPDCAWARFYRGVARLRRGRLTDATDDMECAIDRIGDSASAYYELGRLYQALYMRDQRKARQHISKTGERSDLAAARGKLEQAVVAFEEARRLGGGLSSWQLDYSGAVIELAEGEFRSCVATCDRILERDPDAEEVWKLRGDAVRLCGEDPTESYERAVVIRRNDYQALFARAEYHVQGGELGDARACLDRVRAVHPTFVDGLALEVRLCLLAVRGNGLTDGIACGLGRCDEALRIDPDHYELVMTRAELRLEGIGRGELSADFDHVLADLEHARGLEGCRHRVEVTIARTLLARARARRAAGADPRPDLLAAQATGEAEAASLPDSPWAAVLADVRAELAR